MKTIFITGGDRGIGAALVRAAAGRYNVAFTYNTRKDLASALEKELSESGAVKAFQCNVADPASVKQAVESALGRFSKIEVLVNNAGISENKLFNDVSPADWEKMFGVNSTGAFNTIKQILPSMISRKSGAIINVASVWGQTGASMETHYSASKAALIGLTKALAKELGPSGITVNAVAPGAVNTDMMRCYSEEEIAALCDEIPLGRLAEPEEIASAILFLAEQTYITGQVLGVNGGLVI